MTDDIFALAASVLFVGRYPVLGLLVMDDDHHAWIFVSHSSRDLNRVRKVRDHLEQEGGSPLLFHLKALEHPDEFWPLIAREIRARNFFLYCDSAYARKSETVKKELSAVMQVRDRNVRFGRVRVDYEPLDLGKLDSFLAKVRVFPNYARADEEQVQPFLNALSRAGFLVGFEELDVEADGDFRAAVMHAIARVANRGWVVTFLSEAALTSGYARYELEMARELGSRLMAVLLDDIALPDAMLEYKCIDALKQPQAACAALVQELLQRRR